VKILNRNELTRRWHDATLRARGRVEVRVGIRRVRRVVANSPHVGVDHLGGAVELTIAIELVWDEVADGVLPGPTIHEAVRYARHEMSADELEDVLKAQRAGLYVGDVYGAYVDLRDADEPDVQAAVAKLV
jgi:hypothetical protein